MGAAARLRPCGDDEERVDAHRRGRVPGFAWGARSAPGLPGGRHGDTVQRVGAVCLSPEVQPTEAFGDERAMMILLRALLGDVFAFATSRSISLSTIVW